MKDNLSTQRLKKLHPKAQEKFSNFITDAEDGLNITLRISQALRTVAEQDALYAQGRSSPGKIVTNAKGGQSYHNYGLAIDLVELNKDGSVNWSFDYQKLKPYADKYGLEWGGTFKSIPDKPHFQLTFGYTTSKLLNLKKDKEGYPIF